MRREFPGDTSGRYFTYGSSKPPVSEPATVQPSAPQGTQGTQPPVPPIPKMEAGPSGTLTRRQIRDAARADAKALAAQAKAIAVQARQAAQQAGAAGTLTLPPQGPVPNLPQTTTSTAPPGFPQEDIPPQVMNLISMLLVFGGVMLLGIPIVRVFARRFDRKTQALHSAAPDITPQLQQLQESVDTMAIELERISEAQRFSAKLLSERVGAAGRIEERGH